MLVFTKPDEFISQNLAGQPQPFTSQPKPFPHHLLPLGVKFANTKMLLKVFLRVFQIVLRLGCHHIQTLADSARDFLQTLQVRVPILW
jgi:hypothetical protein